MAACFKYICNSCEFSLEAWDDENPYIEYPAGNRQFFYHPNAANALKGIIQSILEQEPPDVDYSKILQNNAGNEAKFICYKCKTVFQIDPKRDALICKSCHSTKIKNIHKLPGKNCVNCDGIFSQGEFCAIS